MTKKGNPVPCGAKTRGERAGRTCLAWPVKGSARCRMHGGKAGRKPTHGRYTREAEAERKALGALLRAAKTTVRKARERV